ncbi:MAG: shikimate dehydrogenase [Coxiellaceae bacterium]|nr:shikimate dehydrogenase [Coxiellaceae bacterium]
MTAYAVIGRPVAHSLSPQLHQQFAQAINQSINYGKLSCAAEDFAACVYAFKSNGGKGLSVTLPFKHLAAKLADHCDEMVTLTGVANGLRFTEHGIEATNSDGPGLVNDLIEKGVTLKNKSILIIGAGGAAQGIIPALAQQQPKNIVIANRTISKAEQLAKRFKSLADIQAIQTDDHSAFDIILNASSAGHHQQLPLLQTDWVNKNTVAYDLSYGATAQPFVQWCQQHKVTQAYDGFGMLKASAYLLFQWWFTD